MGTSRSNLELTKKNSHQFQNNILNAHIHDTDARTSLVELNEIKIIIYVFAFINVFICIYDITTVVEIPNIYVLSPFKCWRHVFFSTSLLSSPFYNLSFYLFSFSSSISYRFELMTLKCSGSSEVAVRQ